MVEYLLDTNLLINEPDYTRIPDPDDALFFTSTLCLAELVEGEFAKDPETVANSVLQYIAATQSFGEGLSFGQAEVNSYRALCASVVATGRRLTRARRVDLMIAATAHANGMTLATRNTKDFEFVDQVVKVIQL